MVRTMSFCRQKSIELVPTQAPVQISRRSLVSGKWDRMSDHHHGGHDGVSTPRSRRRRLSFQATLHQNN
jgi:hypothetical protein